MREVLIQSDLVECVIGMGEGLFYNSPMPATVIILRATKPVERRGKVLFINAVNDVAREQAQSFLRESHQQKILDAYRKFSDVDGFAAIADVAQMASKGFSLAIPLYVAGAKFNGEAAQLDINDALAEWRLVANEADRTIERVIKQLRQGSNA